MPSKATLIYQNPRSGRANTGNSGDVYSRAAPSPPGLQHPAVNQQQVNNKSIALSSKCLLFKTFIKKACALPKMLFEVR